MDPPVPAALDAYTRKRDFARTEEPRGAERIAPAGARYVIQKHHARRLHYDLRLQVGDVLKSWAVPQGPSLDPATRRLAVATEDHPLDYADYEGVIPKGQYGGGTVLVWDQGLYVPLDAEHEPAALPDDPERFEAAMARMVEKGHIRFWIVGERLRGGWSLIRMGQGSDEWLLIKMKDERADPDTDPTAHATSIVTGRSEAALIRDEGTPEEKALESRRHKQSTLPHPAEREAS